MHIQYEKDLKYIHGVHSRSNIVPFMTKLHALPFPSLNPYFIINYIQKRFKEITLPYLFTIAA